MQTSEKEMLQKEQKGKGVDRNASEEILYKIDIPANRYDMLCLEGIARALNLFNQRLSKIDYRLADMEGMRTCVLCSIFPEQVDPHLNSAQCAFAFPERRHRMCQLCTA